MVPGRRGERVDAVLVHGGPRPRAELGADRGVEPVPGGDDERAARHMNRPPVTSAVVPVMYDESDDA
ncbi:hypothetical protein HDA37_000568 [Pseudonocardia antarctica]|uniref:Uncharacterized protein n=1 Tax=Pseudonocardia alni TaxID=33907 RepID=A0A852VTR6_PSEA5|nr:hypothetical protein [Pseudonocardia antarctica]